MILNTFLWIKIYQIPQTVLCKFIFLNDASSKTDFLKFYIHAFLVVILALANKIVLNTIRKFIVLLQMLPN